MQTTFKKCPQCGSTDVVVDQMTHQITCNVCGYSSKKQIPGIEGKPHG